MRRPWPMAMVSAALVVHPLAASAQSAFAICGDSVPNRIISTGPVRAVIASVDSVRVCLAVEGFTDSAAMAPRDWVNPSRLVVMETRLPNDSRRMQESRILASWTKNGRPLPNDSTAAAWRASVLDMVAAQWNSAARRMEQKDLEQNISALLAQKVWILGQIDTLRRRDDSLRLAVSDGASKARFERQRNISAAQRYESEARSQLSRAQSALAAASAAGDPARIQSARGSVATAEANVRAAADRVRAAQASSPDAGVGNTQDLLDRLDTKGRTTELNEMLAGLDVDNRVATMRAALHAIDAQPDPEVLLKEAAARLRAILAR